jgi:hypothetical protein
MVHLRLFHPIQLQCQRVMDGIPQPRLARAVVRHRPTLHRAPTASEDLFLSQVIGVAASNVTSIVITDETTAGVT